MRTSDLRVARAIHAVAEGRPVVVTDTERDGAGYLAFAADAATPNILAFTVRHTSGLVRVALPLSECERLDLPPMCAAGPSRPTMRSTRCGVSTVELGCRCAPSRLGSRQHLLGISV